MPLGGGSGHSWCNRLGAADNIAVGISSFQLTLPLQKRRAALWFCDGAQADASLAKALSSADIVYAGHDRPFRAGPPVAYVGDYALRIRLFFDPVGMDQEICIKTEQARSFATWPE